MRRTTASVFLVLIFFAIFSGNIFSMEKDERLNLYSHTWNLIETDHIKIMTNGDVAYYSKIAEELEMFRKFSLYLLGVKEKNEEKPIFIWPESRKDFYRLSNNIPLDIVGYFTPSYDYQFAVILPPRHSSLSDSEKDRAMELLISKHEYTHYLTLANSSFVYPEWYSEGVAQYLSTLYFENNTLYVGVPLYGILRSYSYAKDPVKKMVFSGNLDGKMYPKSWALTHYLFSSPVNLKKIQRVLIDGNGSENYGEIMGKYFDLDDLDDEVEKYIKDGAYKNISTYKLDNNFLSEKPSVKKLDKIESDSILTSFLTRTLSKDDPQSISLANTIANYLGNSSQGNLLKIKLAVIDNNISYALKTLDEMKKNNANPRDEKIASSLIDIYQIKSHKIKNPYEASAYFESCKSNLRNVLSENIKDVYAIYLLSQCHFLEDPESEMGIKLLETAIYYRPQAPSLRFELLQHYISKKRYKEARSVAYKMRMAHGEFSGLNEVINKINKEIEMQNNSMKDSGGGIKK